MVHSVAKNEGLRSPKAIAFIFNRCSPNRNRLGTKTYSTLRISILESATDFLKNKQCVDNTLNVLLMKNLGEQIWIK
jgi:hypothetical protein